MLKLKFLGDFSIQLAGQPEANLVPRKAQALLCYPSVTGKPVARSSLAGPLWFNLPKGVARMNLRKSYLFDDWILSQRERNHKQALMVQAETRQDLSLVILATHQQLAIEPWPDEAHADLMRLLASGGHRVRPGFLVPAKPGAPSPNRPAGSVWTPFTGPAWRVCRTTYQKPSWRAPGRPVAAALAD